MHFSNAFVEGIQKPTLVVEVHGASIEAEHLAFVDPLFNQTIIWSEVLDETTSEVAPEEMKHSFSPDTLSKLHPWFNMDYMNPELINTSRLQDLSKAGAAEPILYTTKEVPLKLYNEYKDYCLIRVNAMVINQPLFWGVIIGGQTIKGTIGINYLFEGMPKKRTCSLQCSYDL